MALHRKIIKTFLLLVFIVLIAFVLLIIFISPLVKWVVEKYDVRWTGREVTMDWAYVNPFTSYVYFRNFKIYEEKSDSVALSAEGVSAQFRLWKILRKNYEIDELVLTHPKWVVVKTIDSYNFTSFIQSFTSDVKDSLESSSNFNILKLRYIDGEVYYHQRTKTPVDYYIKNATIETLGRLIDADTIAWNFYIESGPGSGTLQGSFTNNFNTLDYRYNVLIRNFDLKPVQQYLNPFLKYGTFRAFLNANAAAEGNFSSSQDVDLHGKIEFNDFHFGKNAKEDYMAFDTLSLVIENLNPDRNIFRFDSIYLEHPYFKYDVYDSLDNIQTMVANTPVPPSQLMEGTGEFNLIVEIGHYIKELVRNFFDSYFKVNSFRVKNAELHYNDYSMSERFFAGFNPLTVYADSIDKNKPRVNFTFRSAIVPYGEMAIDLSVNPLDTGDYDMIYHLRKLPVTLFNPFIVSYTSYPLDRGTISFNGEWNVRNSEIHSRNHVVIVDPRVNKRIKKEDNRWLPMPLIMAITRERGNIIDYEIPISGNLRHPHFHLKDVVWDAIKNIFVKPPTTPYRMEVKYVERDIEKYQNMKWIPRQATLSERDERFLKKIINFMEENPGATITVTPQVYALREREYITYFEAKKKYYLAIYKLKPEALNEDDLEYIEQLSVRDSSFVKYMRKHSNDEMKFALLDKCRAFAGAAVVNEAYAKLNAARKQTFLAYFKKAGLEKRVKLNAAYETIPFNGFSFYKIEYNGAVPQELIEAYDKLQELNERGTRKRFEKIRKRNNAPVYDVKAK